MIHLEFYKDKKILQGYNTFEINGKTHYEFLAQAEIKDVSENILELDGPVARPTFGMFLYQMAGMLASQQDKYLCLTRSANFREAASAPFEKIWRNVGKDIEAIDVPEEYNSEYYDFTNEEETPYLFQAFKIKETEAFKNSIKVMEKQEESLVPKNIQKEWDEYFGIAYELDSNKFIDIDEELYKPVDVSEHLSFKPKVKRQNKKSKLRQ